jgi:uncharacterized protein (TIGR03086 family)
MDTATGVVTLLERGYQDTAAMLDRIDPDGWSRPSRCTAWPVRQAGNHLVGSVVVLGTIAAEEPVDPAELDPQRAADTDNLGADPADAFRRAAARSIEVFTRPGVLDRRFALPLPDVPGLVLATLSMFESLVHGWDIAAGAQVPYTPDNAVVAAVADWSRAAVGDAQGGDRFGPAVAVAADAGSFIALLGHLGRRG